MQWFSADAKIGGRADAAQSKNVRAARRAREHDNRDSMAVASGLSFAEERAIKRVSSPGYQRSFHLLLIFLAAHGWPAEFECNREIDTTIIKVDLSKPALYSALA